VDRSCGPHPAVGGPRTHPGPECYEDSQHTSHDQSPALASLSHGHEYDRRVGALDRRSISGGRHYHRRVDLERGTLSSLTGDTGPRFDFCYSCGHLRTSHHDPVLPCGASVSTTTDSESYWRDPCPCEGYNPDDGWGRWTFDGKRQARPYPFAYPLRTVVRWHTAAPSVTESCSGGPLRACLVPNGVQEVERSNRSAPTT
jgi:hypothetical protein